MSRVYPRAVFFNVNVIDPCTELYESSTWAHAVQWKIHIFGNVFGLSQASNPVKLAQAWAWRQSHQVAVTFAVLCVYHSRQEIFRKGEPSAYENIRWCDGVKLSKLTEGNDDEQLDGALSNADDVRRCQFIAMD